MRAVGNVQSLKLIDQSVGHKEEGRIEYHDGRKQTAWDEVRREASNAIARKMIQ